MNEFTVHTGGMGSFMRLWLDWHDHNNVKRTDRLEIKILNQDKPRTLRITLNGNTIAEVETEL